MARRTRLSDHQQLSTTTTTGRKRFPSDQQNGHQSSSSSISIVDIEPKSVQELAVSKQKLGELKSWLETYFFHCFVTQAKPFLILNGPTGSGKTTALRLLSNQLNIEYVELPTTSIFNENSAVTTANELEFSLQREEPVSDSVRPLQEESQINRFKRFLADLNHYKKSLLENCSKKILVIEDVPSIFFVKPELLHEELDLLIKRNRSKIVPIIFIISTNVQGESIEFKILPKHIQNNLGIQTITFKPITTVAMTKAINNSFWGKILNKTQIENVVLKSNGDIRHAFNFIQFEYADHGNNQSFELISKRSRGRNGKRIQTKQQSGPIDCDRIESISLSHSMAKILYAKRLEPTDECFKYVETHPNCDPRKLRNPLKEEQPEEISEKGNINSDKIIDWIYENYTDFIHNDDDLESCFDCLKILSDTTTNFHDYQDYNGGPNRVRNSILEEIRTSFVTRGILFNLNREQTFLITDNTVDHQSKLRKNEFRPLKPGNMYSLTNTIRINRENVDNIKNLFFNCTSDEILPVVYYETDLVLDVLPQCLRLFRNRNSEEFRNAFHFIFNLINFSCDGNTVPTVKNLKCQKPKAISLKEFINLVEDKNFSISEIDDNEDDDDDASPPDVSDLSL